MLSQKHLNQVMRRRVNKMIICTDSLLKDSDKIIEYPSQVISNDTNFPFFDTDQKKKKKKIPVLYWVMITERWPHWVQSNCLH